MKTELQTMLLATDGSANALVAARAAADLAQRCQAALHVVHAWQVAAYDYAGYPTGDAMLLSETSEALGKQVLADAVAELTQQGVTIAGQYLQVGRPADEIVNVASQIKADLIVIGSRGLGTLRRLVLGSVAEGVVHHADCPVLVIRGDETAWPPAVIVIGDDDSAAATRAAALGATIGQAVGATGRLVRTLTAPRDRVPAQGGGLARMPEITSFGGITRPQLSGEQEAELARMLDEAIGRAELQLQAKATELSEEFGQVVTAQVLVDAPAAALLAVAEAADGPALIAVGSRGLSALQRLRLGSVSTSVLNAAQCSVLVAPPLS